MIGKGSDPSQTMLLIFHRVVLYTFPVASTPHGFKISSAYLFWKAITASLVSGPKNPVTGTGIPCPFKNVCRSETSEDVSPCFMYVFKYISQIPVVAPNTSPPVFEANGFATLLPPLLLDRDEVLSSVVGVGVITSEIVGSKSNVITSF